MRIYTRTGDAGDTGLLGGGRVPKDHTRVQAYGDIDELNSFVGYLRAAIHDPEIDSVLEAIQNTLLEAGTEAATPPGSAYHPAGVIETDVTGVENSIDRIDSALPPLTSFILPGGSEAACRAHLARCACRRAERSIVRMLRAEPGETLILKYLNRVSDLLFVLARWANHQAGVPDRIWHSRKRTDPSPTGRSDPE